MVAKYTETLHCSKETKELIMIDCVNEFLRHHKELDGTSITQNQILSRIAKYYMGERI